MQNRAFIAVLFVLVAGLGQAVAQTPRVADMIAQVLPAVVRIEIIRVTVEPEGGPGQRSVVTERPQYGSGFVVDPSGIIMTNLHDVDFARKITVILADHRRLPAQIVYRAPIDLALLKIPAVEPLPVITWGDSNAMAPGDPVFAIGNPLGVGITVTTGIISAVHKSLGTSLIDDYLQTDAAINQGNSGGPLLNISGGVVGINSALITPASSSGSVGLGFAISSNDARFVLDQWNRLGGLRGGWLGATLAPVTPQIADAWGLQRPDGAIITAVLPGLAAATAGLRPGDFIQWLDGHPVSEPRGVYRHFFGADIGSIVRLGIQRDGEPLTIPVAVRPAPRDITDAAPSPVLPQGLTIGVRRDLGMTLAAATDILRKTWKITSSQAGLVVVAVSPGTAAARAGIVAGTLLVRMQGLPVTTVDAFLDQVDLARKGGRHWGVVFCAEGDGIRPVAVPLNDDA